MSYKILDSFCAVLPASLKKTYRFSRLKHWAMNNYTIGNYSVALDMADELLVLATEYKGTWNYGNAIHWAHTIRGLVFVKNGDMPSARKELMLSAKVVPSPQLQSFGPLMSLAEVCRSSFGDPIVSEYLNAFEKSMQKYG